MRVPVFALMAVAVATPAFAGDWTYERHADPDGHVRSTATREAEAVAGQAPLSFVIMSDGDQQDVSITSPAPLAFCQTTCFVRMRWSPNKASLVALDQHAGDGASNSYRVASVMAKPVMDMFREAGGVAMDFGGDTSHQVYRFSYAGYDPAKMK